MANETDYGGSPLEPTAAAQLPESVLYRIAIGDAKGRAFSTPRNPRAPTIEEFNPRFMDAPAQIVADLIVRRRHGLLPSQVQRVAELTNEDLVKFRVEDPISGTWENGLSLTGGHHRTAEIIARVQSGLLDPETLVRILIHD